MDIAENGPDASEMVREPALCGVKLVELKDSKLVVLWDNLMEPGQEPTSGYFVNGGIGIGLQEMSHHIF